MQVRVKGRRQGKVCGPDEVHQVTTASGGYPYRGSIIKLRHPPARIPACEIHGLRHSCRVAASVPPCRPSGYIIRGQEDASKLIGFWPLTGSAGTVYISGVRVLHKATGTWS